MWILSEMNSRFQILRTFHDVPAGWAIGRSQRVRDTQCCQWTTTPTDLFSALRAWFAVSIPASSNVPTVSFTRLPGFYIIAGPHNDFTSRITDAHTGIQRRRIFSAAGDGSLNRPVTSNDELAAYEYVWNAAWIRNWRMA